MSTVRYKSVQYTIMQKYLQEKYWREIVQSTTLRGAAATKALWTQITADFR